PADIPPVGIIAPAARSIRYAEKRITSPRAQAVPTARGAIRAIHKALVRRPLLSADNGSRCVNQLSRLRRRATQVVPQKLTVRPLAVPTCTQGALGRRTM